MVGKFTNEITVANDEIAAEKNNLVAKELGIDIKGLVKEIHLFKSYDTYYTSVGDYKVVFDSNGEKIKIKSIVKVNNAE